HGHLAAAARRAGPVAGGPARPRPLRQGRHQRGLRRGPAADGALPPGPAAGRGGGPLRGPGVRLLGLAREELRGAAAAGVPAPAGRPALDRGLAALVEDLHERGLDRDVTVVAWGGFGRSPRINKAAGREHWP